MALASSNLRGEESHGDENVTEFGRRLDAAVRSSITGGGEVEKLIQEFVENPAVYDAFRNQLAGVPVILSAVDQMMREARNARKKQDDENGLAEPPAVPDSSDLPPPEVLPPLEVPPVTGRGRVPAARKSPEKAPLVPGSDPDSGPPGRSGPSGRSAAPPSASLPGSPVSSLAAAASRRARDWTRDFEMFAQAARQAREARRAVDRGLTRSAGAKESVHQERPAPSLAALGPERKTGPSPAAAKGTPARRLAGAPGAAKATDSDKPPSFPKGEIATATGTGSIPPALPPKKAPQGPVTAASGPTPPAPTPSGSPSFPLKNEAPVLSTPGTVPPPVLFTTGDWTVGDDPQGEGGEEGPLPGSAPEPAAAAGGETTDGGTTMEMAAALGIPPEWEMPLALLLLMGLTGITALGSAGGAAGSAAALGPSRLSSFSVARLFAPIWDSRGRRVVAPKGAVRAGPTAPSGSRPALYGTVLGLAWAATFGFAFYLVRGIRGILGAKRRRHR